MFECVDACVCVRTYVRICAHVKACSHFDSSMNTTQLQAKTRAVAAIGGHTFGK